jgi:hypothetical protein
MLQCNRRSCSATHFPLEIMKLIEEFVEFAIPNGRHFCSEFNRLFPFLIEVERSILEENIWGLSPRSNEAKRCVAGLGARAECAAIHTLSTLCAFGFVLHIKRQWSWVVVVNLL